MSRHKPKAGRLARQPKVEVWCSGRVDGEHPDRLIRRFRLDPDRGWVADNGAAFHALDIDPTTGEASYLAPPKPGRSAEPMVTGPDGSERYKAEIRCTECRPKELYLDLRWETWIAQLDRIRAAGHTRVPLRILVDGNSKPRRP